MKDVSYQTYLNQKVLANRFLDNGDHERAIKHFQYALETPHGQDDVNLLADLAFTYEEINEDYRAQHLFEIAVEIDETFAIAHYGLGILSEKQEDYSQALQHLKKAARYAPDVEEIQYSLGHVYEEVGCYDQALLHYEEVLELDPYNLDAILAMGTVYEKQNNNLKAYHYFFQIIKNEPDNHLALFNLGVVSKKLGFVEQAIRYYTSAIAINPEFENSYLNLGVLHKDVYQDYEKSIQIYSMGIERTKYLGTERMLGILYYNRGCCYALTGDERAAIEDIKQSFEHHRRLYDYMLTDEELAPLKSKLMRKPLQL